MYLVRPIEEKDLRSLLDFANESSLGMRSLPKNPSLLEEKIHHSIESFLGIKNPRKVAIYLFVLEDLVNGKMIGCSGITEKTGLDRPLCYYALEKMKHTSSHLRLVEEMEILRPTTQWHGPSELISLYIKKEFRNLKLGPLISLSRFLFIASFKELFTDTIIARLRGVINLITNKIPFWEEIGPHFSLDSSTEILKKLEKDRRRIEELLPPYPIYTSMLTPRARALLREIHESTMPAFTMLKKQGFTLTNYVDLIDAGPTISARKEDILAISSSCVKKVLKVQDSLSKVNKRALISNVNKNFRATLIDIDPEEVILPPSLAHFLQVGVGDLIRIMEI